MSAFTVRKARMEDVPAMHGLLLASARQGLLLPRALIHLYGHVRNFMVAADAAGRTVGCCALAPVWEDLAEICSLVVQDDLRRQGVGRLLVRACLEEGPTLGITRVFALTYQEAFLHAWLRRCGQERAAAKNLGRLRALRQVPGLR